VSSVEPSSTMTHLAGRSDCAIARRREHHRIGAEPRHPRRTQRASESAHRCVEVHSLLAQRARVLFLESYTALPEILAIPHTRP